MRRTARRIVVVAGSTLAAAIVFVVVDVAIAFACAGRRSARVVERGTGRPVPEPRAAGEWERIVLVWSTVTGSRLLCRLPWFLAYLERVSLAAGDEMDAPESVDRIGSFVADYDVDLADVDRDLASFGSLNEFFARPLRHGARPIAAPDDPSVAVSPTDGRVLCVAGDGGTTLRIKGRAYDVAGLLGAGRRSVPTPGAPGAEAGAERVERFVRDLGGGGFAAAICRLAPGDYHRFHWPVDGCWRREEMLAIDGEYHSVATLAVTGPVEVLGRNRRTVAIVETTAFGDVAVVAIGAVKVGSVDVTSPTGEVRKGDEMGVFRYGGSTVVVLAGRGHIRWDAELLRNSERGVETLVRMGSVLGVAAGSTGH